MSNRNNNNNDNFSHPEESRKLWPFFFIIPILGFSFLPIAGSFAPCSAPSCPIALDSIQSSGSSGIGIFGTTLSFTVTIPTANDMIVIASGEAGATVATSITDSQANSLTKQISRGSATASISLDVYTGIVATGGSDTITVTYPGAVSDVVAIVAFYSNVAAIGATASFDNGNSAVTSSTIAFNTTKSGSWITGFTELGTVGTPPTITASPAFVQRTDQPNGFGGPSIEGDLEDTNQSYTANTIVNFSPSWTPSQAALLGNIELIPRFAFPFSYSLCPRPGDTCHVNLATKASGATNGNQLLHAGTTYCTGVTSGKLVTTLTSAIRIEGVYSLESRNVTGQIFLVFIQAVASQPTTTFGSGTCGATTNNMQASFNLYAPVTSTTGTGFSTTFGVIFPNIPPGSYFAAINVTPKTTNVAIDSLGGAGTNLIPGSLIGIIQLK